MYFNLSSGIKKSYLQFFPFSKLSSNDKKIIRSKLFYDIYIKNGSFFFISKNIIRTDGFILKSDNTFRHSTLVSPLLYLVHQAIGKEIWRIYRQIRPRPIKVFYAGSYKKAEPTYKKQYDEFCKVLNANKDDFDFFIKTDISDFYSNINVDKLFTLIDENCNKEKNTFSQTLLQVYKEFTLYCGKGHFACTENSIASSFLSTVIYLDIIDSKLYQYIDKYENIISFLMIRYVDDLYILFSLKQGCNEIHVFNDIIENYSTYLREFDLSINMKKSCLKPIDLINEELKKSLYDEAINNIKFNVLNQFANNIDKFLDALVKKNETEAISIKDYNEIYNEYLKIEGFEYSAAEIFNQFSYDETLIKTYPILKQKLIKLFSGNLSFLRYDPKRLIALLLKTENEKLIKKVLNTLLIKAHKTDWTAYDSAVAVNYLLSRNFVHIDLITSLKKNNPALNAYIDFFCLRSFMCEKSSKFSEKICSLVFADWKVCYLFFMYFTEMAKRNYLLSYAYFKNFFDRFTAILAFKNNYPKSCKNGKPNYNEFFKESSHKKFYKAITDSDEIIKNAHKIRNQNPINHASAEIIDDTVYTKELKKIIYDLKHLIIQFFELNNFSNEDN